MPKKIALLFCLLAMPAAFCQTDSWLQVRTPHFLIVSNAPEKEARRAAHQFEGMRFVFQRVFPNANLDTVEPMLVIAVQDKHALQALEPEVYLGKGQANLIGLFLAAPENNYVLILLNASGTHPYAAIYHEYAHFVFSRTNQWMPLWLTEGIAEFYQNTEILDDRVRIGKGDPYLQAALDRTPLLPLPTLFAVDHHSPYYHENDKSSIFYAESWALTHYLKDKDDADGTTHVNDFLDLVQKNVDPNAAATQAFGDLDQLEIELRKHAVSGKYAVSEISGSTDVDDSSFTVQAISQTQADIARADFLAHVDRQGDARTLLQGVLHDDPSAVRAREILGYVAFRQSNFDESRKWCQEAIKLDAQSFVAHFCFAVASINKGTPDKASQAAVEESLRTAIKLNSSFALPYDALAMFFAQHNTHLTEANDLIQTAVQLLPGSPEIRVDQAQVLSSMNKDADAFAVLDLALKMAHTPEQTAAVEQIQQTLHKYADERAKNLSRNKIVLAHNGNTSPGSGGQATALAETPPKAIYSPSVEYTDRARAARLEGICTVSLVVGIDGRPSNVVVTKKLGMGLDERVVETVSHWKFEPGHRNGRPVISHLTMNLQFKLFGADNQKFFDLSEKANSGDANAEFELANAFFQGRDIPKDETKGMALLERAARSGHAQAQFQMGERIYGDGNNSGNYVEAYVWYSVAQRSGASPADAKVTELESRMTPEQLSEGRKRLESWPSTSK
jgi:TonB family protein